MLHKCHLPGVVLLVRVKRVGEQAFPVSQGCSLTWLSRSSRLQSEHWDQHHASEGLRTRLSAWIKILTPPLKVNLLLRVPWLPSPLKLHPLQEG